VNKTSKCAINTMSCEKGFANIFANELLSTEPYWMILEGLKQV